MTPFKLYYRTESDNELQPLSETIASFDVLNTDYDNDTSDQWEHKDYSLSFDITCDNMRTLWSQLFPKKQVFNVFTKRLPRKKKKQYKSLLKKAFRFEMIMFKYNKQ